MRPCRGSIIRSQFRGRDQPSLSGTARRPSRSRSAASSRSWASRRTSDAARRRSVSRRRSRSRNLPSRSRRRSRSDSSMSRSFSRATGSHQHRLSPPSTYAARPSTSLSTPAAERPARRGHVLVAPRRVQPQRRQPRPAPTRTRIEREVLGHSQPLVDAALDNVVVRPAAFRNHLQHEVRRLALAPRQVRLAIRPRRHPHRDQHVRLHVRREALRRALLALRPRPRTAAVVAEVRQPHVPLHRHVRPGVAGAQHVARVRGRQVVAAALGHGPIVPGAKVVLAEQQQLGVRQRLPARARRPRPRRQVVLVQRQRLGVGQRPAARARRAVREFGKAFLRGRLRDPARRPAGLAPGGLLRLQRRGLGHGPPPSIGSRRSSDVGYRSTPPPVRRGGVRRRARRAGAPSPCSECGRGTRDGGQSRCPAATAELAQANGRMSRPRWRMSYGRRARRNCWRRRPDSIAAAAQALDPTTVRRWAAVRRGFSAQPPKRRTVMYERTLRRQGRRDLTGPARRGFAGHIAGELGAVPSELSRSEGLVVRRAQADHPSSQIYSGSHPPLALAAPPWA